MDLFRNLEKKTMKLGLNRIKKALVTLKNPCNNVPAIHIVGTNGKGSIASFIESSLISANIKSGVTTSPHILNWRERIRINGDWISKKEFKIYLQAIKPLSEKYNLSAFEVIISIALQHFENNRVEILVLEAGLGGRLDATTAHSKRPIIALSGIGLDHTEILGKDLIAITNEKTAVINSGCTVITSEQHPDVKKIIQETVKKKNAIIKWVKPLSDEWDLGLKGEIQKQNAAVAKGALEELRKIGFPINQEHIKRGFKQANWAGRLEKITWKNKIVIIDSAHNTHAAEQLAKERDLWSKEGDGVCWILGIQINKDGPMMIQRLIKPLDKVWIVPIPNYESWNKTEISSACINLSEQLNEANDVEEVLESLLMKDKWPETPPIIAGSIYLLGNLLKRECFTQKR